MADWLVSELWAVNRRMNTVLLLRSPVIFHEDTCFLLLLLLFKNYIYIYICSRASSVLQLVVHLLELARLGKKTDRSS